MIEAGKSGSEIVGAPDHIHIARLEVSAFIGVPEAERAQRQRLTISLTLRPRHDFSALRDDLWETIDYVEVSAAVQKFFQDRSWKLIETVAHELAAQLLGQFPLDHVAVEVRKFVLRDAEFVAVRVERGA